MSSLCLDERMLLQPRAESLQEVQETHQHGLTWWAHQSIPVLPGLRQQEFCKLEARLGYIVSPRAALATQCDIVSKKPKQGSREVAP